MDHRPKSRMPIHKTSGKKNMGENLHDLRFGDAFKNTAPIAFGGKNNG